MKGAAVAIAMMVAVVFAVAVEQGQAITCQQVTSSLAPCVQFLTGGGNPSASCCAGVNNIKNATPTRADRQTACNCIKAVAAKYPQIKDDAASQIPAKCGVQIDVPISRSVNCNNIP